MNTNELFKGKKVCSVDDRTPDTWFFRMDDGSVIRLESIGFPWEPTWMRAELDVAPNEKLAKQYQEELNILPGD